MKPEVAFTVYGVARPAGSKRAFPIRKNGQLTGRIAVVDDCKDSRHWKTTVTREAIAVMQQHAAAMFLGPVRLTVSFEVLRPKGHFRTGVRAAELRPSAPQYPTVKPDLLKLTRAVEDALTGIVWRDDAQVVEQRLEKRYGSTSLCTIRVSEVAE